MNPLDNINGWKLWPSDASHLFATSSGDDSKWAKFRVHSLTILRNVFNFFSS